MSAAGVRPFARSSRLTRRGRAGELQRAMWAKQFTALRDGDRLFYLNDPALVAIQHAYGVSFQRSLAELISADTGEAVDPSTFTVVAEVVDQPGSTPPTIPPIPLPPASTPRPRTEPQPPQTRGRRRRGR